MGVETYTTRRGELQQYFDRTAAEAWARLTSTAKVSRIRETVRAGRDRMRATLLSWLPEDLSGRRVLDAGCGTGALAVEAARRGAEVLAVDLSPTLLQHAGERLPPTVAGRVRFHAGDMLDPALGRFDHVVAMDSLIHYAADDMLEALAALASRTSGSIVFTFAPRTPLLSVMHAVGKWFPRADRAPAIEPVAESHLLRGVDGRADLAGMMPARSQRVHSGFYTSHALELRRR
ncbi:MAG: magnesium protoporphyrin IX methyltransferase [Pseudomonadota bacterium]